MTLAIPLQYSQSHHLTCTLEVNGLAAVFLVDTGASNSCFDQVKKKDQKTLFSLQPKGEQLPMTAASETPLHVRESQKITLSSNQLLQTFLSCGSGTIFIDADRFGSHQQCPSKTRRSAHRWDFGGRRLASSCAHHQNINVWRKNRGSE